MRRKWPFQKSEYIWIFSSSTARTRISFFRQQIKLRKWQKWSSTSLHTHRCVLGKNPTEALLPDRHTLWAKEMSVHETYTSGSRNNTPVSFVRKIYCIKGCDDLKCRRGLPAVAMFLKAFLLALKSTLPFMLLLDSVLLRKLTREWVFVNLKILRSGGRASII